MIDNSIGKAIMNKFNRKLLYIMSYILLEYYHLLICFITCIKIAILKQFVG